MNENRSSTHEIDSGFVGGSGIRCVDASAVHSGTHRWRKSACVCCRWQLSCFHLVTSDLDYREDATVDVVQVDVPGSLVAPIEELVRRKGFDYCALDFRCRNGFEDPVFLEVNSFPMFVRFDDAGQNCIVNSILDFLQTTKVSMLTQA